MSRVTGGCRCRQTPADAASASCALHQAYWCSALDQNLPAGQQSRSAAASSASCLLTARLTDLSKWGISSSQLTTPTRCIRRLLVDFLPEAGVCVFASLLPPGAHCIRHILLFWSSPHHGLTLIQFKLHLCVNCPCSWRPSTCIATSLRSGVFFFSLRVVDE